MKKNIVWGIAIAGFMTAGLIAQTQDQSKNTTTTDRKVTVQGCLERDASPNATASSTAFKLTQVDVIKDEPMSSNVMKDMAKDTGDAMKDVGKGTADAVTFGHADKKDPSKDIALQVSPAPNAKVDLGAQVNHKVELVGTMSAKDVDAARAKSTTAAAGTPAPALTLKATSIKSLADKCQ